jgi:hypothetical protein
VARQRFREGVGHYDRQEYDKARLAFLQAYLLKPHPAVLLNLAQSELRAGRHAEAAENFARYIRQNPTAPAMEHAKAAFEEARQKVAELNLQVSAVGAVVSVDGSEVGRSPLPTVIYLMPGRHTIAARKGGLSSDRSLDAVAGQRVYITLDLQGGPGSATTLGAAAASDGALTQASQGDELASEPVMDTERSQDFFSWMANSPAAIATVTVAGVALGTSAVLAGFANNRYAVANDVRDRIMREIQDNVDEGVLVESAAPCGERGIANGVGSFNPLVTQDDVDGLVSDYANACRLFSERSDSGDRLKTLSLVSLGVGAFATVGTVVWYFSDTSSGNDSAKADVPSKRRASISPILTPDTQGVWLNLSF